MSLIAQMCNANNVSTSVDKKSQLDHSHATFMFKLLLDFCYTSHMQTHVVCGAQYVSSSGDMTPSATQKLSLSCANDDE